MKRGVVPGRILLYFSAVMLLALLAFSWSMPPVDASGFRQTQTALTIEWLARGYPFFSYITPVVGAPWSIPFEFPLFQWLAAVLSNATGMEVGNAARVVSSLFHIGSIWVLYRIVLAFRADPVLALCIAAAYAMSPYAQFWGRSVMMESTAVFFGLAFVWAMARLHAGARWYWGAIAIAAAVLSALVKVTTFFGFAFFVAVAFAWLALREHGWRPQWLRQHGALMVWGVLSAVAVLAVMVAWLDHADTLKAQSPIGEQLTSSALSRWNYGTLQQRLDPATWWGTLFKRRFPAAVGSNWVFLIILVAGVSIARIRAAVLLLLVAYLAPFLVFTNLHIAHPYYQAANVVFATSIVGLVIWWVIQRAEVSGRTRRPIWLVALLCLLSFGYTAGHYLKNMKEARAPTQVSEIARAIKGGTAENTVIVAFGLDWSSELPYFAGRRAVMVPDWAAPKVLQSLAGSDAMLGDGKLGALVNCPNQIAQDPGRALLQQQILQKYSAGATAQSIKGCEVWLQP